MKTRWQKNPVPAKPAKHDMNIFTFYINTLKIFFKAFYQLFQSQFQAIIMPGSAINTDKKRTAIRTVLG